MRQIVSYLNIQPTQKQIYNTNVTYFQPCTGRIMHLQPIWSYHDILVSQADIIKYMVTTYASVSREATDARIQ